MTPTLLLTVAGNRSVIRCLINLITAIMKEPKAKDPRWYPAEFHVDSSGRFMSGPLWNDSSISNYRIISIAKCPCWNGLCHYQQCPHHHHDHELWSWIIIIIIIIIITNHDDWMKNHHFHSLSSFSYHHHDSAAASKNRNTFQTDVLIGEFLPFSAFGVKNLDPKNPSNRSTAVPVRDSSPGSTRMRHQTPTAPAMMHWPMAIFKALFHRNTSVVGGQNLSWHCNTEMSLKHPKTLNWIIPTHCCSFCWQQKISSQMYLQGLPRSSRSFVTLLRFCHQELWISKARRMKQQSDNRRPQDVNNCCLKN